MESFFLAETTKYLYLLFDPENFIHNNGSCGEIIEMSGGNCVIGAGGYVFNTEAHPIDIGAVYCCSAKHFDHQMLLYNFQKNMDLHALLEIRDSRDFLRVFKDGKKNSTHRRKRQNFQNNVDTNSKSENVSIDIINATLSNSDINFKDNSSIESVSVDNDSHIDTEEIQTTMHDIKTSDNTVEIVAETKSIGEDSLNSNINNMNNDIENNEGEFSDDNSDAPEFNFSVNKSESEVVSVNVSTSVSSKDSNRVYVNSSKDLYDNEFYNYELLSCPAQPYSARLNLMGEMFNT